TAAQVRELLRTTTASDRAGGYGPRHGFGSLSLATALLKLRGNPAVLVSAFESDVGVNRDVAAPQYDQVTVTVTPRDVNAVPLGARRRRVGTWGTGRATLALALGLSLGMAACAGPEPEAKDPGQATPSVAAGSARRGKPRPGGDYFWRAPDTLERAAIVIHLA